MEKKLIVKLHPFILTQTVYICSDNNIETELIFNSSELELGILKICKDYNINNVILTGSKMYAKGIQKKIEKTEKTVYQKNTLNITLL